MMERVIEILKKGLLCTNHWEVISLLAILEGDKPVPRISLKRFSSRLPMGRQLEFLKVANSGPEQQQEELWKTSVESIGSLMQVQVLHFNGIPIVSESLGNLTQLQELYLMKTTELSDALCKLVGLKILRFTDSECKRLQEHVGDLLSLHELSLNKFRVSVELPLSLGRLSHLRSLNLERCYNLDRLLRVSWRLTQLRSLSSESCCNLERLPYYCWADPTFSFRSSSVFQIGVGGGGPAFHSKAAACMNVIAKSCSLTSLIGFEGVLEFKDCQ